MDGWLGVCVWVDGWMCGLMDGWMEGVIYFVYAF